MDEIISTANAEAGFLFFLMALQSFIFFTVDRISDKILKKNGRSFRRA